LVKPGPNQNFIGGEDDDYLYLAFLYEDGVIVSVLFLLMFIMSLIVWTIIMTFRGQFTPAVISAACWSNRRFSWYYSCKLFYKVQMSQRLVLSGTRTKRSIRAGVLLLEALSLTSYGNARGEDLKAVEARPTGEFLDSLGVVTHMGYNDGRYASAAEAVEDLDYLGIHQLRDGLPRSNGGGPDHNLGDSLKILLNAGNRFDFLIIPGNQTLSDFQNQLDAIVRTHPDAVIAIEGPNEINNAPVLYKHLTGEAAGRAFQRDLFDMVVADPLAHNVPVYYFTGGQPIDLTANPGLAHYANAHPYPYRGQAPGPRIREEFKHNFNIPLSFPRVITETGYFNRPENPGGSGVDDLTQSKLTLDLLFDAFQQGVAKTFLYQLRAAYPDKRGDNSDTEYGLFKLDNSPKPVAIAIHNLTAILSRHQKKTLQPVNNKITFSVAGLPLEGHQLLLENPDGSFALVLWAEPRIWDEARHAAVDAPKVMVKLSLSAPAKTLELFDPLVSAVSIQTSASVRFATISLTDHPVIVQIR